jgi:hypothetical protein
MSRFTALNGPCYAWVILHLASDGRVIHTWFAVPEKANAEVN